MFKSLNLNREMIQQSIRKYMIINSYECNICDFEQKGTTRRRVQITGDHNLFIDFQFLGNGSTSIDLVSGGVTELKKEIAQFIKDDPDCSLSDVDSKSKWFVVQNINESDILAIIELLCESEYTKEYTDDKGVHKFIGTYNEKLVIHYYQTTRKVMLQGRPLLLFNEAVIYLTELVEIEDLPKTFNTYLNINIDKDNINTLYQYYFPSSYDKHNSKMKKVLHQVIYNLQIDGDMYDYSFIIFPAFKALEGHLKIAFKANNIQLEKNNFNMFKFDPVSKKYYLDSIYHGNITDQTKIKHFEDAYNFYKRQRHTLFHWANPSGVIDETRLIENLGEAKGLIQDAISIIDEYYKL